jgi:hypothetical protein
MAGRRPRVRGANGELRANLYQPVTTLGWRRVLTVTVSQGQQKVAAGEWIEVLEADGRIGFQARASHKTDHDLPSMQSTAAITMREMDIFAGTNFPQGKSRTLGMNEEQRMARPRMPNGHIPPPEDAIERAIGKVCEWGRNRLVCTPHVEGELRQQPGWLTLLASEEDVAGELLAELPA